MPPKKPTALKHIDAYDAQAVKEHGLTPLEVMPPESATQLVDVSAAFTTARAHALELHNLGRRVNHISILLGVELNRVHTELGIGRGGDKAKCKNSTLPPWKDLVTAHTGLSYETCNNLMRLAAEGKKHIPILMSQDLLETPFSALPEARQAEVKKAISKIADGGTMHQLMLDFGVITPKKLNHPPKGGKSDKNNFKGGAATRAENAANQTDATLAEAKHQLALEHLKGEMGIIAMQESNAWMCLDDTELIALDNALDAWRVKIKALITEREATALRAKAKKKGAA